MNIQKPSNPNTCRILNSRILEKDGLFRPVRFCVEERNDTEVLLYNTLTEGMIALSPEEYAAFKEISPLSSDLRKSLAENGFLVPKDFDEYAFVDDCRTFTELKNSLAQDFRIFYIYPTTGCNARCFYCFEEGIPVRRMSMETAEKTAEFIIQNTKDAKVRITWFGGEPTTGIPVIDFICERLNRAGIDFYSVFKTNGYLLDDALLSKFTKEYHTTLIQIPIDGIKETYDQTKAYVNVPAGESAFDRVILNIGKALNAGIRVDIRLNIGMHNAKEVPEILEFLASRFGNNPAFGIFPQVLNEGGTDTYTAEERNALFEIQKDSYRYLITHHVRFGQNRFRLPDFKCHSCMADSPECVGISPEGYLSKCPENINHANFFGSVYDPEKRLDENIDCFMKKQDREECRACIFYPSCCTLENCIGRKNPCSDAHRDFRLWKTREFMRTLL